MRRSPIIKLNGKVNRLLNQFKIYLEVFFKTFLRTNAIPIYMKIIPTPYKINTILPSKNTHLFWIFVHLPGLMWRKFHWK